jgi:hypothetical protein
VGQQIYRHLHGLTSSRGLAADLPSAWSREHVSKAAADNIVVIRQQQPKRLRRVRRRHLSRFKRLSATS